MQASQKEVNLVKHCSKCKQYRPVSSFYTDKYSKSGTRSQCKACCLVARKDDAAKHRIRARQWYEANRALCNARSTINRLHKYGLTPETYKRMVIDQMGLCAICVEPEVIENKPLAVDHCHTTGKTRALLCQGCNIALGNMKDSPILLTNAINYLKRFT